MNCGSYVTMFEYEESHQYGPPSIHTPNPGLWTASVFTNELPNRGRLGLAGCAHQTGWDIQLPGWPKSPCCGDGLASQVPKCLAVEIDTLRIMGAASEGCISGFHHHASDSDAHIKARAALRLNQRPFLTFFAVHKYDEIGLHLLGDSKCRLAV
jgi:hypothetical protein